MWLFLYSVVFSLSNGLISYIFFNLMATDQSHEHSNRQLQAGDGGLFDLHGDTDSIALYMLAAPDSAIFLNEFEKPS